MKYADVFGKLKSIGNTSEQTNDENIKLQECYLDQLTKAVTLTNKDQMQHGIETSTQWYDQKKMGIEFRNKFRGQAAEDWQDA